VYITDGRIKIFGPQLWTRSQSRCKYLMTTDLIAQLRSVEITIALTYWTMARCMSLVLLRPMSHVRFCHATLSRNTIASVIWRVAQLLTVAQLLLRIEHVCPYSMHPCRENAERWLVSSFVCN